MVTVMSFLLFSLLDGLRWLIFAHLYLLKLDGMTNFPKHRFITLGWRFEINLFYLLRLSCWLCDLHRHGIH